MHAKLRYGIWAATLSFLASATLRYTGPSVVGRIVVVLVVAVNAVCVLPLLVTADERDRAGRTDA